MHPASLIFQVERKPLGCSPDGADYHQHFHGRGPSPSRGPFSAVSDFLLLTIFSQKVQLAQGRLPPAVPSRRREDFFRPPPVLC